MLTPLLLARRELEIPDQVLLKQPLLGTWLLTRFMQATSWRIPARAEMVGIPADFLGTIGSVAGFVWQKLLPTLCHECKQPISESDEICHRIRSRMGGDVDLSTVFERNKAGCLVCNGINPGLIVCAEIIDFPDLHMCKAIREQDDISFLEHWKKRDNRIKGGYFRAIDHALSHALRGVICPRIIESELGMITP